MAADGEAVLERNSRIQDGGHGGKRAGAGRRPGARGQLTLDGQKLAQQWGPAAIEEAARMAGLIRDKEGNPVGRANSEAVRASALGIIIDRAFGKAAQPVNHGDNEGGKLSPTLNIFGSGHGQPASSREAGTGVSEQGD